MKNQIGCIIEALIVILFLVVFYVFGGKIFNYFGFISIYHFIVAITIYVPVFIILYTIVFTYIQDPFDILNIAGGRKQPLEVINRSNTIK